jgi:CDP-paratose 2-epimerase
MDGLARQVFNIGGGLANTTSLLELMEKRSKLHGKALEARFAGWLPADYQF